MLLNRFSEEEIRQVCKTHLETLELWLRRLITDKLRPIIGDDFLHTSYENNQYILGRDKRDRIRERASSDSERYPRMVDAALLDDIIDIICNQHHYRRYFSDAFQGHFIGNEHLRFLLSKLIEPRNRLSHANSISSRHAEKVICYTNDVVDSLKDYYASLNMQSEYNSPIILRIVDNFGNVTNAEHPTVFNRNISFRDNSKFHLYPGDTLTLEANIDSTFSLEECEIRWSWYSTKNPINRVMGEKLVLHISNSEVNNDFSIHCQIKSNKDYHRFGEYDDGWNLRYKIVPNVP